jgi:hypothetical protein
MADKTDSELNLEIADLLAEALCAMDKAYGTAKEAWGEKDSRTELINSAWAESETVFQKFKE